MKTRTYLSLMAGAILVPVIAFSWFGFGLMLEWERESRLRAVQETARATALIIDREIAAANAGLRVLAHSKSVRDQDMPYLYSLMTNALKSDGAWTVLSEAGGKALVNTGVPYGAQPSGDPRLAVPTALDEQKSSLSGYFVDPVTQHPALAVHFPVNSVAGRKLVLSQVFRADYFNKAIRTVEMPASWIAGVFDSDGVTIARTIKPELFVGKRARPEILEAARKATSGVVLHPSRENLMIYDVFVRTELTGWTVAIGVPQNEIEAPAWRAALYAALAFGVIFAIAAAIVIFLARRLSGSLEQAAGAAKMLGQPGVPVLKDTRVHEVNVLQNALQDAGNALAGESESRRKLETEREQLLISEREARKLAEAQNRAKDDFLAMLGHELRNPLGAISGAFSIMEAPNAGPEQLVRARVIGRNQVNHLAHIVDDLLDIGRIMAGKVLLRKQALDLGELVRRCVESQRAVDPASHEWEISTESVWVQADATRLEQIIGNVLVNAVKYTPRNGAIRVEVRREGDSAVVVVQDNGIGISPELLPTIFDVFVQGPTTIDRAQGGLGLGLSLVKQLLALHGGSVTAASEGPGKGSTFTLRLPENRAATAEVQAEATPRAAGQRKYILVVEDNQDAREMLTTALALHGFTVAAAASGEEALKVAAETRPDVAIVDVGLPGISGYTVAERLQAGTDTRHIKLIALTGYGLEQDRQFAMRAGFSAHLTKPYTIEGLLDAIAREI
jgi:signal transduction histidine kinase